MQFQEAAATSDELHGGGDPADPTKQPPEPLAFLHLRYVPGKPDRIVPGFSQHVKRVGSVAPDGKTFAASGQDGRIALWKTATEKPLWQTQLPGAVLGLAYSGDSRHLATANANGTIFILRLPE